jgi:hypothetical protein
MDKSMTTSGMTTGQIDRACEIFRAQLTKHAAELPSDPVQQVFGQAELGPEWLAVLRKRVEAISDMIIRRVTVNRSRTPQDMLDATSRKQYTDRNVVKAMPRGKGEEVEVYFFKLGRFVSDDELQKEYELRGLTPDPYAQAQVNIDDPAFADERPNGTHWKDGDGRWCFAAFNQWRGERGVDVDRSDDDWYVDWWFAGVRK